MERCWGRAYWWIMIVVLGAASAALLLSKDTAAWPAVLAFGAWTLVTFLAARRWPRPARVVHALGTIPLSALYVTASSNLGPASSHMYLLLTFFPIYTASAALGPAGAVAGIGLAWIFGDHILDASETQLVGLLFWVVVGFIGHAARHFAQIIDRQYQKITALSLTDPLTGLGNRRALEEDYARFLALAKRQNLPLTLILWDLNGLKAINDRFGHAVGDAYLKHLARTLRESARQSDGVYRVGGDEFASLHLGLKSPELYIERVKKRFPDVAAGWAVAGTNGEGSDFLRVFETADLRLYQDKRSSQDRSNGFAGISAGNLDA